MTLAARRTALGLLLALLIAGVAYEAFASRTRGLCFSRLAIVEQPRNLPAMNGLPATFQVLAKGLRPLHYQWLRNGVKIPGATSATYTTPAAGMADDGTQFSVVVSNWLTTLTSHPATLTVLPPARAEHTSFPLRISSNGRYLVDQNGNPFRLQGEAAWSLFSNLTYDEADRYLSDRAAKGFNTVIAELIEHKYAQGGKGSNQSGVPTNRAGALPFLKNAQGAAYDGTWGTADFSTPNDSYFAFDDSIIDLAAKKGMLVNLAPMFLGFDGNEAGWWADLTNRANTRDAVYNFGVYIGRRYKDRKNLIWIIGGDYFPPSGSEGEARLLKLLQGIKAGGVTQLWSGDWKASSLSVDEEPFTPLMDLNAVYTYGMLGHGGATYGEARSAYLYSPAHPAYLKETGYEDESFYPGSPPWVRMYAYYAILGGATEGAFFGNRDIWKFGTAQWWSDPNGFGHGPWTAALESRGTYDFVILGRLLDSIPWYDLVPSGLSGMKKLVLSGAGNYSTVEFVVSAATPDGKTLLAYIPPTRKKALSIGIDMTALAAPANAAWFDPGSGRSAEIPGGPFANVATRTFTSPGENSEGDFDWVLVLRAR